MALTINSNIASLQTQRAVQDHSSGLSDVFQRLSSGQRINRASDDSAGLAISELLKTDARVYTQGVRNLNDGLNLTAIADGALDELSNIVIRIRELSEQAANGTFGLTQRKALDAEAQQLSREFWRISQTTSFNGLSLFNGTTSQIALQAGYGSSATLNASIGGAIGDGTFGAATSYAMDVTNSVSIKFSDINGDGVVDMVSGGNSAGTGTAYVRLGISGGSFGTTTSYALISGALDNIALEDLNNDGAVDLVAQGADGGGSVSVRLNLGNGTFGANATYQMDVTASDGFTTGDFNNDGSIDIVTVGNNAGVGSFSIRLGNGNGTFGAVTRTSLGGAPPAWAVATGDMDGNGTLDLLIGRAGSNFLSVSGNGNGTFGAPVSIASPSPTNGVSIGDLNNDGRLDFIVAASAGAGNLYSYTNNGNGTYSQRHFSFQEPSGSNSSSLADLNGDGNLDAITLGLNGAAGETTVRMGNGDGTFGAATSYTMDPSGSYGLTVADVNGDGVFDLTSAGIGGAAGKVTVRLGNAVAGVAPLLPISLKTIADARQSMGVLDNALDRITTQRGTIGAVSSRLTSAASTLTTQALNYTEAQSRIADTDVATDAGELARLNILQQASIAVLAQANQLPATALKLLEDI